VGVFLGAGCNRPPQAPKSVAPQHPVEETFSVSETFRKVSDIDSSRNAIQQLNRYLSSHPDLKPPAPSPEMLATLRDKFCLDPGEIEEVQSSIYTLLDAQHLDFSLLLRDAVRSLKLEDRSGLEKATAGFYWVVRQIGLQDRRDEELRKSIGEHKTAFPPHFAVRRGWGNAMERALVFLAVLEQLGIDGCMVAVPADAKNATGMRNWIPAALVEGRIYLFDTRLGLPIPGANGEKVATLTQARSQPDVLKKLTVDPGTPYDVTADQLKRAEIRVSCPLSAMSPRINYLQEVLGQAEGVRLWGNPVERLERFQKAAGAVDLRVRGWNQPGDNNTPVRALRYFIPPSEGGVDSSGRRGRAIATLMIPRYLYPNILREVKGEPGQRMRGLFENPYPIFALEPKMPHDRLQAWLPGLFEPGSGGGNSRKSPDLVERERMPRDLMLHGRLDEAANELITIVEELRKQRSVALTPELAVGVRNWCEKAIEVYGSSLRLEREARNPKSRYAMDPMALEHAQQEKENLWVASRPVEMLIRKISADYMAGEVTYLMASCKQEQAERAQAKLDRAGRAKRSPSSAEVSSARNAWRAAAGWWNSYLDEFGAAHGAASARVFKARALQALGDSDAARSLLKDIPADASPFDRLARLYLAKQLDAR
jgi:hypothetical protein